MKEIIVFTDGSCVGNGKKITFGGYGIYFPYKEFPDISEPFTLVPITNQRAELYAILKALQLLIPEGYQKITLYTDSEYSIKSITEWASGWEKKGWKTTKGAVKNLDLIKPLHQLYQKHHKKINLVHVRSHTGKEDFLSQGNAEADRLAVTGSKKSFVINPRRTTKKESHPSVNVPPVQTSSSSSEPAPVKVIIKRHRHPSQKRRRIRVFRIDSDNSDSD